MKPLTRFAFAPLFALVAGCLVLTSHDQTWPCTTDDDCEDGNRCLGGSPYSRTPVGTCRDPLYCESQSDCRLGFLCEHTQCVRGQCNDSTYVACGNYACDVSQRACMTSCASIDDCSRSGACRNEECVPRECHGYESECSQLACKDGFCKKSCKSQDDCYEGYACVRKACLAAPGLGDACDGTHLCRSGVCVSGYCKNTKSLCDGKECGVDQGVSCGECGWQSTCDSSGMCVASP
jgi:hypothetical protein